VHAKYPSFGNPPFALFLHEFSNPIFPDIFQIFNLAHPVFFPIAVIQMLQLVAGKLLAIVTKKTFPLTAHPQMTLRTGLRLLLFGVIASMAGFFLMQIRLANSAIHSAGSN
jgi:hypothetical protein